MKKSTVILLIALFCSAAVFAQNTDPVSENEPSFSKDTISYGSCALIESRKSGGGLTFAFPLFQKDSFVIRNEFLAFLYLSNTPSSEGTMISFGDKIHFGSLKDYGTYKIRSYGYMKCECGISKDSTYSFFEAPVILEMGGAGGFEFIFDPAKSFFVEFGGGAAVKGFGSVDKALVAGGCFNGGYVCLTTGIKHYIK